MKKIITIIATAIVALTSLTANATINKHLADAKTSIYCALALSEYQEKYGNSYFRREINKLVLRTQSNLSSYLIESGKSPSEENILKLHAELLTIERDKLNNIDRSTLLENVIDCSQYASRTGRM